MFNLQKQQITIWLYIKSRELKLKILKSTKIYVSKFFLSFFLRSRQNLLLHVYTFFMFKHLIVSN